MLHDISTPDSQLRKDILTKTLDHVVFDGWNNMTLNRACQELGVTELERNRLYPYGISDLINEFYLDLNTQTLAALKDVDMASMKIHHRIITTIKTRITLYEPYREAIRRLVSWIVIPSSKQPQYIFSRLFETADLLWRTAGDTSTDFSYYTKRLILISVYSQTLLYWLNDRSPNYEKTWKFLDKRIQNVLVITKVKFKLKSMVRKLNFS